MLTLTRAASVSHGSWDVRLWVALGAHPNRCGKFFAERAVCRPRPWVAFIENGSRSGVRSRAVIGAKTQVRGVELRRVARCERIFYEWPASSRHDHDGCVRVASRDTLSQEFTLFPHASYYSPDGKECPR